MTELLLIRHGQTDWNRQGRYHGHADVPLNAVGLAQAQRLAEQLEGQTVDLIVTSDLQRARQTAEILAAACGAPVVVDARLREIDQGDWQGQLFDTIRSSAPEAIEQRRRDPLHAAAPGGETLAQVRQRVLAALREIHAAQPAGCVAIVSHGLALALIRVQLRQLPLEAVWDLIPGNAEMERTQWNGK